MAETENRDKPHNVGEL